MSGHRQKKYGGKIRFVPSSYRHIFLKKCAQMQGVDVQHLGALRHDLHRVIGRFVTHNSILQHALSSDAGALQPSLLLSVSPAYQRSS